MNGAELDSGFDQYRKLAEAGIGGYIIFGGKLPVVREAVRELNRAAGRPLLVMSDLEQGLGQHVDGGTLFPPAMAMAMATCGHDLAGAEMFRAAVAAVRDEALDAGINVILAPVADVHTNPSNPIICTRAYGNDPAEVSWFVREHVRAIQQGGTVAACAKHFPGHGDTAIDSHLSLPLLAMDEARLEAVELAPFRAAIDAGVSMIMAGHLRVDAFDDELPATLSHPVIDGLLRRKLGFDGVVITDAMNMGAITGRYGEARACLMALIAGCDIILHPDDPMAAAREIAGAWEHVEARFIEAEQRVEHLRAMLAAHGTPSPPDYTANEKLAETLSFKALRVRKGETHIEGDETVIVIDDDNRENDSIFLNALRAKHPGIRGMAANEFAGGDVVVALFSKVAAWKGRSGLSDESGKLLDGILKSAGKSTVISFGCPSILDGVSADALVDAWWTGGPAQRAAARLLGDAP
ncbi:MAG: hypothetical protein HZA20_05910 [Nitrospirae bacterium]|nr:hypothetical protein [Nitrospirota bacterium]